MSRLPSVRPCMVTVIREHPATAALAKSLQCQHTYAVAVVGCLAAWLHKRRDPRFSANETFVVESGVSGFDPDAFAQHLIHAGWIEACVARDGRAYYELREWETLFPEERRRVQLRKAQRKWRASKVKAKVLPPLPEIPKMREPTAAESIAFLESRGYVVGAGGSFDD